MNPFSCLFVRLLYSYQQHLVWSWHKEIAYQTPVVIPASPYMMHYGTVELTIQSFRPTAPTAVKPETSYQRTTVDQNTNW